jgi:hypothetical protein
MLSQCRSEFSYDNNDEAGVAKELTLQVRKVIGPFAAPKKIIIVSHLPKIRSDKVRFPVVHWVIIVYSMFSSIRSCARLSLAKAISLVISVLSLSLALWKKVAESK